MNEKIHDMQKEANVDYPYEKLDVWKKAVDLATKINSTAFNSLASAKHHAMAQALVECATAIATAIAEGKSYPSGQDFIRHLYHSRGFVYKTMTLLKIFAKQKIISEQQYAHLDEAAQRVTAMLSALIKSISGKNANHVKTPK